MDPHDSPEVESWVGREEFETCAVFRFANTIAEHHLAVLHMGHLWRHEGGRPKDLDRLANHDGRVQVDDLPRALIEFDIAQQRQIE